MVFDIPDNVWYVARLAGFIRPQKRKRGEEIMGGFDKKDDRANAELLAAASELLGMLRETVMERRRLHSHYYKDGKDGCPTHDILDRAAALIKRLEEGGAND
jgi:hypothetical protein